METNLERLMFEAAGADEAPIRPERGRKTPERGRRTHPPSVPTTRTRARLAAARDR